MMKRWHLFILLPIHWIQRITPNKMRIINWIGSVILGYFALSVCSDEVDKEEEEEEEDILEPEDVIQPL